MCLFVLSIAIKDKVQQTNRDSNLWLLRSELSCNTISVNISRRLKSNIIFSSVQKVLGDKTPDNISIRQDQDNNEQENQIHERIWRTANDGDGRLISQAASGLKLITNIQQERFTLCFLLKKCTIPLYIYSMQIIVV